MVKRLLLLLSLLIISAPPALCGPFDVHESDIRGVWNSEAEELVGIGRALWQAGQKDKAESKFKEAYGKASTPADRLAAAEVLADFYVNVSNGEAAVRVYEALLGDSSYSGDSVSMSRIYVGLGKVYYTEGFYVKAIKSFRSAEQLVTAVRDSLFTASLYSNMARTLLESGDVEEALSLVQKARQNTPSRDVVNIVSILTTEASIEARFGNHELAYQKMVEASKLNGDVWNSEISYILNSAAPSKINQDNGKRGGDLSQEIEAMQTAIEQADSMRRAAYAVTFVVGLLFVAALISFYFSHNRLRYYQDRSKKLDKKLNDAQRVISIIAHDSNNHFNAILGLAGVIAEKGKGKGDEMESLCRHIFSSAQLLYQIMNNLLTWSRSKENLNPRKQEILLSDSIRWCVSAVNLMAKDKDITITVEDVPENIRIFADSSHIEIILRNIISNAVKFTHPGGHVVIRAAVYSKHAAVSVDDDGCGMSQEDVARFNREQDLAPNAGTGNEMGNGLGLAICRDLVRNNGGSIVIEPGRKKGTSVTVLLNTV